MANENETVADIGAMFRRFAKGEELPTDEMPSFTSIADRLEAAHEVEVAALKARLEAVVKECERWKWADDSWVNQDTAVEDHNRCIVRIIRAARGEGGVK